MCGIVGVIAKSSSGFNKFIEDSFLELLYVDAVRGYDSTGVVAVRKDGSYGIAKEATDAGLFLPAFKGLPMCKDMYMNGKAYIGHNRKKTVGTIEDATAHPFVVDDTFAMVHNGTLHSHKHLAETTTDSEALAKVFKEAFDEKDYKPALEEVLGQVYGAYATVMYDQKRECVRMLRNKDRPLWVLNTNDAVYFASEAMMATWILCRNSYQYKDIKVEQLPEHEMLTYDLVKNTIVLEKLTPKKAPTVSYTPTIAVKDGGQKCGGTVGNGKPISKQMLKFFRKKWIGKRISFWVDDYVEKNFPRLIEEDGETQVLLFAQSDEIALNHSINVEVDLSESGFSTVEELYEHRWSGVVDKIEYNEQSEGCVLYLTKTKPVLPSLPKKETVATYVNRTQLTDSLKTLSLAALVAELSMKKYKLSKWEIDVYEEAIAERRQQVEQLERTSHALGLKAALEAARAKGQEIVCECRNGKTVWFDDTTNEVIYESPTVLH